MDLDHQGNKEKNVLNYYVLCNQLKNTIRSGWKIWNVKKERIESIAEHIFGVQMLAIAMKSEFNYNIDIMKVILMLAIHELGEIVIGDLTCFDIKENDKKKIEHEAVHKILNNILDGKKIEELFLEFDEHITKEALFAFQCDKLEADLQCKLYDEDNYVDLNQQASNKIINLPIIQELLNTTNSWSELWIEFDKKFCDYDDNFKSVLNYVLNNKINKYPH